MRRLRRILITAAGVVLLVAGLSAVLAAGLFVVAGGLGSGGRGGSAKAPVNVAGIAAAVTPGASAVLIAGREPVAGAQRLQVTLPAPAITPPPGSGPLQTDPRTASLYAGAGWRAALIAGVAATKIPRLTQYVATDKAGGQAAGASFYLDGSVRSTPGAALAVRPMLDTVSPASERKQLDDNIAALRKGLPAGSVLRVSVRQITVDPSAHGMAYSVALRVTDLRRLRFRFGDVFAGLATGLAPGPDSTVEGLAIHVEDAAGRSAGSWIATRSAEGTTVVDPRIHLPRVMVPHIHFVNETGGPQAIPSAPAGPVK
ncbi:MAG: hypothetical protein QOH12_3805 [Solirubrobacteraceae bacterium]|jgi:hypothetical protein|nr:hypothetical protein [Solirubrobacteraceae bacterium]